MEESRVRAFYSAKNIFITGGTGFVGQCVIEKILRSIPDVASIYMLMRPKKGKEIAERLKDFTKNSIFETLVESKGADVFKKLVPVAGDVGEENLGLSPEDRHMLTENVHVVIHSAATLDFQEQLRPTVRINVMGTRRVLELCKNMKHLKAMVHVSSAYANSFVREAEEKVYDTTVETDKVIAFVSTLSDEALLEIEPKLLGEHPNTYTFTKHLAEHEVKSCSELFPCTIVRPSMIVAAWKEPVPGWTDSKVGPQGFLMGASKGVVRRLPIDTKNIADYIPVDVVANQLIVAGYSASTADSKELSVYHCTSSTLKPFRWGSIEGKVNGYLHKYPLKSAIWYPHLKFVSSLWLFKLSAIFVHFIPAYILDMVLRLTGGRPILVRLHKNVWNSLNRLEPFIFNEWRFFNRRTVTLSKTLNEIDARDFYIDISKLNWEEYFVNLTIGVRRYLNKEKMTNIAAARGKDTILLVAHVVLQLAVVGGGWYAVAAALGYTMRQCAWAAPLTYLLYSLL